MYDTNREPVSDLTPIISIWEVDTNDKVVDSDSMNVIPNTGFYKYDFSSFDRSNHYLVLIDGGLTVDERYRDGALTEGSIHATVTTIETISNNLIELVKRTLGLIHENHYTDQYVYDENNLVTSCRFRIYSDSVSVGSNDNVIATYIMEATYNGLLLNTYKVTKI